VARFRLAGTRKEAFMPQGAWSKKRERQYEHIKESYEDRGRTEDKAEELAARTVNKERAEKGETKSAKSRSK
jgi:plasmid stabilization system protein ParE